MVKKNKSEQPKQKPRVIGKQHKVFVEERFSDFNLASFFKEEEIEHPVPAQTTIKVSQYLLDKMQQSGANVQLQAPDDLKKGLNQEGASPGEKPKNPPAEGIGEG